MTEYKGGRGKKAPYETEVVRIPKPVLAEVMQIVSSFKDGEFKEDSPDLNTSIDFAKKILNGKKSAKVSMVKLIAFIYSEKEENINL